MSRVHCNFGADVGIRHVDRASYLDEVCKQKGAEFTMSEIFKGSSALIFQNFTKDSVILEVDEFIDCNGSDFLFVTNIQDFSKDSNQETVLIQFKIFFMHLCIAKGNNLIKLQLNSLMDWLFVVLFWCECGIVVRRSCQGGRMLVCRLVFRRQTQQWQWPRRWEADREHTWCRFL